MKDFLNEVFRVPSLASSIAYNGSRSLLALLSRFPGKKEEKHNGITKKQANRSPLMNTLAHLPSSGTRGRPTTHDPRTSRPVHLNTVIINITLLPIRQTRRIHRVRLHVQRPDGTTKRLSPTLVNLLRPMHELLLRAMPDPVRRLARRSHAALLAAHQATHVLLARRGVGRKAIGPHARGIHGHEGGADRHNAGADLDFLRAAG